MSELSMQQLQRLVSAANRLDLEAVVEQLGVRSYDRAFIGGESGRDAGVRPCDLRLMGTMARRAERAGIPIHMKQIGSRPVVDGQALKVRHPHGGRIAEWPAWLPTTRALPAQWTEAAR